MIARTLFVAVALAMSSQGSYAADVQGAPVSQQQGGSRSGGQQDQDAGRNDTTRRPTPVAPAAPADPAYRSPDDMQTGSGDSDDSTGSTTRRSDRRGTDGRSSEQGKGVTDRPTPVAPAAPADPRYRDENRR